MIEKSQFDYISEDNSGLDEKLWLALKDGDRNALEQLFRRHYEDLFQYSLKMSGSRALAEDCIQDLFLKIWRRRNYVGEVKGVKTYLWTALRRSLITALKNKKKNSRWADPDRSELNPVMKLDAEELIIKQELDIHRSRQLEKAMDRLSSRHREVLYLKFYEGMSYNEIEHILSISYQTARNHACEALKALKVFMSESPGNV